MILVLEVLTTEAELPPIVTEVPWAKPVPSIWTKVPPAVVPDVGEMDVMLGAIRPP